MRLLFLGAVLLVMVMAALGLARDDYDYHQDRRQDLALERAEISTDLHAQWAPFRAALWNLTLAGAALGSLGLGLGLVWQRLQRPALQQPNTDGTLPLLLHDPRYFDAAVLALTGRHGTDLERAAHSGAVPVHYAPHIHAHTPHGQAVSASSGVPDAAPLPLPGVTDLAMLHHDPGSGILLGLGAGGQRVTAPPGSLFHIAVAGDTGAGKGNTARLLLAQLLALGAHVCVADPHWADYDAETGEDWRPIRSRLHLEPAYDTAGITDMLQFFTRELDARLERRRQGQKPGRSLFLYCDELAEVIRQDKRRGEDFKRLVEQGRKVALFTLVASQDLLAQTMGTSAAGRENYRTGFWLGGDVHTGSALLNLPRRELAAWQAETGLAWLRAVNRRPAVIRVPYASNAAISQLLPDTPPVNEPVNEVEVSGTSPSTAAGSEKPQTAQDARILALASEGTPISRIVEEIFGVKGGGKYAERSAYVMQVIAERLKMGA